MSSRWGFDLSMSAVRLMRREGGHWQEIASENIDGADIEDRLMAMVNQIENGAPVELFLPRDQILYTDVKLDTETPSQADVLAAMDGRTPYALDELEIDWEMSEPGSARVAAIARDTLDEAAAFAEARGLAVSGFSSLADVEDFPRHPDFGHTAIEASEDEPEAAAPAFSTTRETVSTDPLLLSGALPNENDPVVRVDEPTPVMQVKAKELPPLDPGTPIRPVSTPPRVRTDIAAGTLSGAAASLTPPGPSIQVRSHGSKSWQTLAVFAVAAALTIGIAIIVWSVVPLAPGGSDTTPSDATESQPAPEATEQSLAVPETPDLPQPTVFTPDVTLAKAEPAGTTPDLPTSYAPAISRGAILGLTGAVPDANFSFASVAPLDARPASLASLLSVNPIQGLDGSEDTAETSLEIYLASIEHSDLASDAIALPDPRQFSASGLPTLTAPPADASAKESEIASVDPTAPVTEPELPTSVADEPETAQPTPPIEEDVGPKAAELRPTELAAALPDRAPRRRPGDFSEKIERQSLGGYTRDELAKISPRPRPESAQIVARIDRPSAEASELAVATSSNPRSRPGNFATLVTAAREKTREQELAAFATPDTSAAIEAALADDAEPEPRPQATQNLSIPTTASVARQATVENAIRLNRVNLVGVYGVPSDRRALIRLPSGRYVKVKVGDRVDGGTVAQIGDTELIYRKGGRLVSLELPKG